MLTTLRCMEFSYGFVLTAGPGGAPRRCPLTSGSRIYGIPKFLGGGYTNGPRPTPSQPWSTRVVDGSTCESDPDQEAQLRAPTEARPERSEDVVRIADRHHRLAPGV